MQKENSSVIIFEKVVEEVKRRRANKKIITVSLSGHYLDRFNDLERRLDKPGAMAYFRDGLWLAALAISHDSQGNDVRLWIEYVDDDGKLVQENLVSGKYRLHSLCKFPDWRR